MQNFDKPNDITISFSLPFFKIVLKETIEDVLQGYAEDRLLTRKQLLNYFQISATSLHTYQKQGLPFHKLGRLNLYRKSEIDAYIEVKKKGGRNGS